MSLCRHFSLCGGCSAQDVPYASQLLSKEAEVKALFSELPVEEYCPIVPCVDPWAYRNKMEFSFSQDKAGQKFLGLVMKRSRGRVLNLEECFLVSPWYMQALEQVRGWWVKNALRAYHRYKDEGSLRTLTLREGKTTGTKMALLTVSGNPAYALARRELDSLISHLRQVDDTMSIFLQVQQAIKGQPTQFYEMHLAGPTHIHERLSVGDRTFTFKISPTSFFQPNSLQAQVLYARALEMAPKARSVFDLYAGTATLGILFASKAEKVHSIEINPHACFDAEANKEVNEVFNLAIHCGDVEKIVKQLDIKPDLVLVDPPRSGTNAKILLELAPETILYISCNPKTQVENCKILVEGGYRLVKLQPVDQFPHTPHIENIALLKRESRAS